MSLLELIAEYVTYNLDVKFLPTVAYTTYLLSFECKIDTIIWG